MQRLSFLLIPLLFAGCGGDDEYRNLKRDIKPPPEQPKPDATTVEASAPPRPANGDAKLPDLNAAEWKEIPNTGGLKYWDVKLGTGAEARLSDTVTMHYTGWLKNGTVFDSSHRRGVPLTSKLKGVNGEPGLIEGWQVGVPGMKVGGIRRLDIPYAMAYGEGGRPGIPGRADLIFEIELLGTK